MSRKSFVAILVLGSALLLSACGDESNSTTSNNGGSGGSGAAGASGGSGGAGATGGSGGTTSTSESTTSESTTSTTSATGCMSLGDTCSDCLFANCNAEYCACFANPACGAMVLCAQNCAPGDAACTQSCFSNNSAGISQAALAGDCGATQCAAPTCTGTTALGPCEKCLFTSCQSQMNKCLANEDCNKLIQCAQACPPGDDGCQQDCAFANLGGVDDALEVQSCLGASCQGQCP